MNGLVSAAGIFPMVGSGPFFSWQVEICSAACYSYKAIGLHLKEENGSLRIYKSSKYKRNAASVI